MTSSIEFRSIDMSDSRIDASADCINRVYIVGSILLHLASYLPCSESHQRKAKTITESFYRDHRERLLLYYHNHLWFLADLMQADITRLAFHMCDECLRILELREITKDILDTHIERFFEGRDFVDTRKSNGLILDGEAGIFLHDTDDKDSL